MTKTSAAPRRRRAPRRGIVLGGGGVLGAAWAVGALCAVEQVHDIDVRTADYFVGTSAGAVLAALLGAGIAPGELRDHQRGLPIATGPLAGFAWDYAKATGGSRPPLPRLGWGSPRLLSSNVRRLHQLPPTAVLAAMVPEGRGTLSRVTHLVDAVSPMGHWSQHPGVWIVAMDYVSGRRVPFGRPGEPPASLAEAVTASCAIPGWYSPVEIGGHRYIDGGACSATSVDLVAGLELDEVYVIAPMVSFATDRPRDLASRLERRWRAAVTKRCLREAAKVAREGTRVTILGPGPEDLAVTGYNLMDVERRLAVLETSLRTSRVALEDPTARGNTLADELLAHAG